MTISAKFSSGCRVCGGRIAVGDRIEWTRGEPAVHAACVASRPATMTQRMAERVAPRRPAAPRPSRSAYPTAPPTEGAHEVSGRRTGRADRRYEVGATIHGPRVGPVGGGPDGHYYTVLAARIDAPCEDMGHYDWREHAWVRAATVAEAAPVAARGAEREIRAALASDLNALPGERVPGPMPEIATVLVPRDCSRSCATGERVAVVDGAILHERVGDPDMSDSWRHYIVRLDTPEPELVARVAAYIASVQS